MVDAGQWQIELACETYNAQASLSAFFDPSGNRVKT
jgi:hypothetical protein